VLENSRLLQPSPLVRKFAPTLVKAASSCPIIDVACGSGRNAFYIAEFNSAVICVDRDLTRIKKYFPECPRSKQLTLLEMDLLTDPWPFGPHTIGGIVLVDFLDRSLFMRFEESVIPGGYILVETVSGRRGNYLELPKAGELKMAFENSFEICVYKEAKVGPNTSNAVTVKMFARRRAGCTHEIQAQNGSS
jgi:SAM-dependent methyltransferase